MTSFKMAGESDNGNLLAVHDTMAGHDHPALIEDWATTGVLEWLAIHSELYGHLPWPTTFSRDVTTDDVGRTRLWN